MDFCVYCFGSDSLSLAAVSRESGALSPAARNALDESIVLAGQTSREIRDTASLLHPPLLDETGLASALSWYAEGFSRRTGIDVRVEVAPDVGRLGQEVETAVFRIVQECLTNVHRHSGSSTVMVRVVRAGEKLRAVIADVGRGMPDGAALPNAPGAKPGIGLLGMHERARQLGGRLRIRSSDHGTAVRITLPLGGAPRAPLDH